MQDPGLRIVESNEDVLLYDTGHIPGAVHIDWREDLQDHTRARLHLARGLCGALPRNGIGPDTTVLFYGDKSNWWSCYALWAFRLFGHTKVKILDGGRDKWVAEGRPLTKEKPKLSADELSRCRRSATMRRSALSTRRRSRRCKAGRPLIDVRSPGEFKGDVTHMPEYPQEGVLRGGHIPGAKSVPWKTAVNDDATFKSADELRKIYTEHCGLKNGDDIIAYCRIGERSSHTWFVLTYLLGYEKRAQLRRLLDGMGQQRPRPHRAQLASRRWPTRPKLQDPSSSFSSRCPRRRSAKT